jgi:hypothetical protein
MVAGLFPKKTPPGFSGRCNINNQHNSRTIGGKRIPSPHGHGKTAMVIGPGYCAFCKTLTSLALPRALRSKQLGFLGQLH